MTVPYIDRYAQESYDCHNKKRFLIFFRDLQPHARRNTIFSTFAQYTLQAVELW